MSHAMIPTKPSPKRECPHTHGKLPARVPGTRGATVRSQMAADGGRARRGLSPAASVIAAVARCHEDRQATHRPNRRTDGGGGLTVQAILSEENLRAAVDTCVRLVEAAGAAVIFIGAAVAVL